MEIPTSFLKDAIASDTAMYRCIILIIVAACSACIPLGLALGIMKIVYGW